MLCHQAGQCDQDYTYDADNERLTRSRSGITTAYLAGSLWEEDSGGATRILYSFGGKVIAQRDSSSGGSVSYSHGDHLGSTSLLNNQTGGLISQRFGTTPKPQTSSLRLTISNVQPNLVAKVCKVLPV